MEGEAAAVPIVSASTSDETNNPNAGMSQEGCTDRIREGLKHPTVRFLREQMEKAGCPVWMRLLLAINCRDQGSAGGYASKRGITICCNHMTFQDEINQVLIHELIHACDDCRAKNMDWKNCAHHACSEIRANHLSGDCHYKRELLRGFMKIRGHEQEKTEESTTMKREVGGLSTRGHVCGSADSHVLKTEEEEPCRGDRGGRTTMHALRSTDVGHGIDAQWPGSHENMGRKAVEALRSEDVGNGDDARWLGFHVDVGRKVVAMLRSEDVGNGADE